MTIDIRSYPNGTSVTHDYPWGWFVSATVLCTDGKLRKVKRISSTADTFFSVPASVEVRRKWIDLSYNEQVAIAERGGRVREAQRYTVAGYVTMDDDGVRFIAYSYGKNGHLLPGTKVGA